VSLPVMGKTERLGSSTETTPKAIWDETGAVVQLRKKA